MLRNYPPAYWALHKLLSPFTTNAPALTKLIFAGMSQHDRDLAFGDEKHARDMVKLVAEGLRQVQTVLVHLRSRAIVLLCVVCT